MFRHRMARARIDWRADFNQHGEMNSIPRRRCPFGGMKLSGNGREGGLWGIEDFLEIKSVSGWTPDA